MFDQIVSVAIDIGLGALALSLVRALKANVTAVEALTKKLVEGHEDHEKRITALENREAN